MLLTDRHAYSIFFNQLFKTNIFPKALSCQIIYGLRCTRYQQKIL